MDQMYMYETKIIDVADPPFDKEPFYAIVFLFALLILFVAYHRRKHNNTRSTINGYITNYNVLSLPVDPLINDQYPDKGILFNTGSSLNLLKSFLYCMLAVSIFGSIVLFLYPFLGSQYGCFG